MVPNGTMSRGDDGGADFDVEKTQTRITTQRLRARGVHHRVVLASPQCGRLGEVGVLAALSRH